jgi:hypothetical protein
MDFEEYRHTTAYEQVSSLKYLVSPGAEWKPPASLKLKVGEDGSLKPFFGDTVVIPIQEEDLPGVTAIQQAVTGSLGGLLARPLSPELFHVTLHDLSSGSSPGQVESQVSQNREQCREIFGAVSSYLKANPDMQEIQMESTCAYPSCNISIVLGFSPASDRDYRTLMNFYNLFDDVVFLSYWLRPHITLAYFRPGEFTRREMDAIHRALGRANESRVRLKLNLWKTAYQHFRDMDDYRTIFSMENAS